MPCISPSPISICLFISSIVNAILGNSAFAIASLVGSLFFSTWLKSIKWYWRDRDPWR